MTRTCERKHYVYIVRFDCSLFMLRFDVLLLSYFSIDMLCIHVSFLCYRVLEFVIEWA